MGLCRLSLDHSTGSSVGCQGASSPVQGMANVGAGAAMPSRGMVPAQLGFIACNHQIEAFFQQSLDLVSAIYYGGMGIKKLHARYQTKQGSGIHTTVQ